MHTFLVGGSAFREAHGSWASCDPLSDPDNLVRRKCAVRASGLGLSGFLILARGPPLPPALVPRPGTHQARPASLATRPRAHADPLWLSSLQRVTAGALVALFQDPLRTEGLHGTTLRLSCSTGL